MRNINAESTIEALNKIFVMWGYPLIMQSDNGPPFQSKLFINTWQNRGIVVRKSIPLSPQSNGAIERQNQGIKKVLAGSKLDNINWRTALDSYIHNHNKVRPLSRLGVTPFELLVGWKWRGTFPCLWETKSNKGIDLEAVREKDAFSKQESKRYTVARRGAKESNLVVGDRVVLVQQKRLKVKRAQTGSNDRRLIRIFTGLSTYPSPSQKPYELNYLVVEWTAGCKTRTAIQQLRRLKDPAVKISFVEVRGTRAVDVPEGVSVEDQRTIIKNIFIETSKTNPGELRGIWL
ncbi:uncharacterized protein LOC134222739 [Armigeres subalbatus]|uniref:uncharacterized protein LOC134222739 n=1 Tax=Armigeres subalbatus TaxID=124917 RepID=UPI002ED0E3AF